MPYYQDAPAGVSQGRGQWKSPRAVDDGGGGGEEDRTQRRTGRDRLRIIGRPSCGLSRPPLPQPRHQPRTAVVSRTAPALPSRDSRSNEHSSASSRARTRDALSMRESSPPLLVPLLTVLHSLTGGQRDLIALHPKRSHVVPVLFCAEQPDVIGRRVR